ncbi:MAG: TerC family protein [Planctomycetaceae bacterium]|nr:TerC family protein [Planctomycetaceae bacterium]
MEILAWHWAAFSAFVVLMLVLDLGVFHRHSRETTLREAGIWTVVWLALALVFNVIIWKWQGPQAGGEFLAGYLTEWALSMDNVFVFAVIFSYFRVPMKYQHRVLFWGILGAVVLRLTFILIGKELIQRFEWLLPILGLVLLYTGVKLAFKSDEEVDPEHNPILKIARKFFRVARGEHGNHFLVREEGKLCVTPLFLVLLVVESTDVLFAVDSVPTIFGLVTTTAPYFTFVVFTSNVFAILGLRALYFLLAGMMNMFRYLSYGLSAILVFVGFKMCGEYAAHYFHWVPEGQKVVPWQASLGTIVGLLTLSIAASVVAAKREAKHTAPALPPHDHGDKPAVPEETGSKH